MALTGETLKLNMWADAAQGQKLAYAWTVSSGTVQTAGGNVFTWRFDRETTGPRTADGELRSAAQVLARCMVEVQVISARDTPAAAGFLAPGSKEDRAGLYSYLLLTSGAADTPLRQSTVRAWMTLNAGVMELRHSVAPASVVALLVPVTDAPASGATAAWVLEHYDFIRARTYLEKVSPNAQPGIYIVSTLQPLMEAKAPYLIQDLSHATPEAAAAWVEAFVNEAAQQRAWSAASEADLIAQLRITLRTLAKGMDGSVFLK